MDSEIRDNYRKTFTETEISSFIEIILYHTMEILHNNKKNE